MTSLESHSDRLADRRGIAARATPLTNIDLLGQKWRHLEQRSSCSFFQSWTWIGTWLSELPKSVELYLLEVADGDRLIGLAVFGARTLARHGFVRSRALLLHETGSEELDRMTIEYNSILAETGKEREVVVAGVNCLKAANIRWDEFMVSGVEARAFEAWHAAVRGTNWRVVFLKESKCYFVDLDAVRDRGGDYLALLSSNTRQQVRQSIKAYEKSGSLRISAASSAQTAVEYLHGLQKLHDAHWQGRGEDGAFSSEFTRNFHERLVRDAVARAEVQMLRVTAGDEVVGYLYNFVRDGHVYFYQSGFTYTEDPKLRPGLVCHYLAIMHNLKIDNRVYDFLAGAQRYKQSLGAANVKMYWIALQKPRLVFAVERLLKRVKSAIRRADGRSAV
ncbi:MAG: GNAT family N-acetyltransferase [Betaproteobacteria bacterium]|nr:GNAT family N-acetyltransferase [Betaproteobacteria bacterium]